MSTLSLPDVTRADCPSRRVLDLISDKWTTLIVIVLAHGPKRYNQLRREVSSISHKMLSQTLHQLEEKKLVNRRVIDTKPPQVEYSLTPLGETLLPIVASIAEWAEEHAAEIGFKEL